MPSIEVLYSVADGTCRFLVKGADKALSPEDAREMARQMELALREAETWQSTSTHSQAIRASYAQHVKDTANSHQDGWRPF